MAANLMISSRIVTRLRRRGGGGGIPSSRWVPPASSSSFYSTSAPAISTLSESLSSQSPEKEGRSIWSKCFLFLPGAITFGLGTWQIFRREDKIKMLEYRQEKLQLEPIRLDVGAPSGENSDSFEFRRVVSKGAFDEGKSIYVGPRSRSISGVTENGYYIITPLIPIPYDPESVQSPLLVNRGWVPRSWRDKALESSHEKGQSDNTTRLSAEQSEQISWWSFWSKKPKIIEDEAPSISRVEVIGVVRGSENPSIFVPANDPSSGQWFYVDVPAIARSLGLPENTLYVEDINENVNPSNPYPVPKDVNTLIRSSVMPQDHLNYTLTWYSLSTAVTFMAFKRLRPVKSRR